MESKRNILITGGAGFIGSHVVRLFVNKYPDYHIINLDKLTYAGNLANLHDIKDKPNYTFIKADICDFETVLFYHISTDEVYGALEITAPDGLESPFSTKASSAHHHVYGEKFFTEENSYHPHSPYSAAKAASDHFVRSFHDTYGMPTLVTNCSNNYGPYQFPEKLIPLFINRENRCRYTVTVKMSVTGSSWKTMRERSTPSSTKDK